MIQAHRIGAAMGVVLLPMGAAIGAPPKSVILFIGDGMGVEQVKAAGYYFNGEAGQFSFEQLDHFAWMTTNRSDGFLTDSAASATAMATGFKVDSNVVSTAVAAGPDPRSATPSDGRPLTTLLEVFAAQGKSTGIVTSSFLADATPGAFGAHVTHRNLSTMIASDYLNTTRPDVLLGGGGSGFTLAAASSAGYSVVSSRAELQALDMGAVGRVAGAFGDDQFPFVYDATVGTTSFYEANPYLHEMTETAINLLSRNLDGFFLMVENELTDAAGHLLATDQTKLPRTLHEVREMDRAVEKARAFSLAHPDTLIIVAADHETGGYVATKNNGIGVMPGLVSGEHRHNASMVPVDASGPNAGHVMGIIDNTDIPRIITSADAPPVFAGGMHAVSFRQGANGYAGVVDTELDADAPMAVKSGLAELVTDGTPTRQVLISFADLFGPGAIPADAQVVGAKLSIYGGTDSANNTSMSLHRLLVPFDADTTYATAGGTAGGGMSLNGPGSEDDDYLATPDFVFPAPSINAVGTFDVTGTLAAWLEAARAGEAVDYGWVLINTGTNSWGVHASETEELAYRPMLEVTFGIVPEPMGLAAPAALGFLLRRRRGSRATSKDEPVGSFA